MRLGQARREDPGAAAVEFALVLPVLLLLIFGIVDFGRMLNAKITLTEAAREGARAAALVDDSAGVDRVDTVAGHLDDPPGRLSVSVDGCPATQDPAADATVTLTYSFTFVTPIAALVGLGGADGSVDLTATGIMPCL